MQNMYQKLKRLKGERFAQTLRNFHSGIMEIPDLDRIVRHAGEEAEPLLPYLMAVITSNDNAPTSIPQDPFTLLDQAGYNAFYADTLEKQNSIKHHFAQGELLCTFNDCSRYKEHYIVHAVKKDVNTIKREDFKGKEQRQDAYGTSVISIQMLKDGGFISIKNRYNHAVSAPDNTFKSNPDNIIDGLSTSLKNYFNVTFSTSQNELPEGFILIGNKIFKYNNEIRNVYYGDQALVKNGVIHEVNKSSGDALFEKFLFDNKKKVLRAVDPTYEDRFVDDFNRYYGGNRGLNVRNGNLYLNDELVIGAEQSRIKTLYLSKFTSMSPDCLSSADYLTHFEAPLLKKMSCGCLRHVCSLIYFKAEALEEMGDNCVQNAILLKHFIAPALKIIGLKSLFNVDSLIRFEAPSLKKMCTDCLHSATALTHFIAPALETLGAYCLYNVQSLIHFEANSLQVMQGRSLVKAPSLKSFVAKSLLIMRSICLQQVDSLTHFEAPRLKEMWGDCLTEAPALTSFKCPNLKKIPFHIKKNIFCARARSLFFKPLSFGFKG